MNEVPALLTTIPAAMFAKLAALYLLYPNNLKYVYVAITVSPAPVTSDTLLEVVFISYSPYFFQ
jgi:hypothetical protein